MSKKPFRIAITGATSPKGKALKQALPRSRFRDVNVRLLDEEYLEGTLTEYDGGVELIRQLTIESFSDVDLVFFCDEDEASSHLEILQEHFGNNAPVIIDLSGSPSPSNHKTMTSRYLPRSQELGKSPIFLPHPLALGIAQVLDLCSAFGNFTRIFSTALIPVSDRGKGGIEALHEQLIEIMNFGNVPKDLFNQQLIFNILPSVGPVDDDGGTDIENSIKEQVCNLIDNKDLPFQLIMNQVPTFYSYAVSMLFSFDEPIEIDRIRRAFKNAEGFSAGKKLTTSGPLETTDSSDYRLARLLPIPNDSNSVAIWFTFDNLIPAAVNEAIAIAEELFSDNPNLTES